MFGWNCTVSLLQIALHWCGLRNKFTVSLVLVETVQNAPTEFILASWNYSLPILVETTDGPHWVNVPCIFYSLPRLVEAVLAALTEFLANRNSSSPYVWSKPTDGPHWDNFPCKFLQSPKFGWSCCCGSLWATVPTRKVSLFLVETTRRLSMSYCACHYYYSLPRLVDIVCVTALAELPCQS
jgi:hypothetical protein